MNKQDAPARIEAKTERPTHPSRQFLKKSLRGGSRSRAGFAESAARGPAKRPWLAAPTRIASALMMFASACPGTDRRQLIDVVADDKKRGFVGGSPRPSAIRYGLRPLPRRAKARSSPSSRCQPSSQWRQSGMPQMSWSS